MSIIIKDGYKFYDGLSSDYIVVEDGKLNKYIKYINEKGIKSVSIVEVLAYNRDEIDFLKDCPSIENVNLISSKVKNYSGLYSLKELQELDIDCLTANLELSRLPNLKYFSSEWNKKLLDLESCKLLERLGLSKFNPSIKNFKSLSKLKNLKEIILIKSNITSFKGIGELTNLEKADFSYLRNLEEIDELKLIAGNLKHLRFDGCKKIKNHEYVTCLKELELLSFDNCGDIPSIKFINELPKLKKFIFIGSNIVDGDLSPCNRLEYVGFWDKKHYSHKMKDFKNKMPLTPF